jgi:hypothetical protein
LVEDIMEKVMRDRKPPIAKHSLVLIAIALSAAVLSASCSAGPPKNPKAEDTTLETSINARLNSDFPCGVYATADGNVVVTMSVEKSSLGSSDAAVRAAAQNVIRRVFSDVPEVKSIKVLDRNKQELGTFSSDQ